MISASVMPALNPAIKRRPSVSFPSCIADTLYTILSAVSIWILNYMMALTSILRLPSASTYLCGRPFHGSKRLLQVWLNEYSNLKAWNLTEINLSGSTAQNRRSQFWELHACSRGLSVIPIFEVYMCGDRGMCLEVQFYLIPQQGLVSCISAHSEGILQGQMCSKRGKPLPKRPHSLLLYDCLPTIYDTWHAETGLKQKLVEK